MIGDYKLKESETHWAGKYSLSTTNLALNGLCDHQERKTKMTVQLRVRVCVSVFMCVCVEEDSVYLGSFPSICVSNGLWMFPR